MMADRVHPARRHTKMAGAALPPPAVYHERRKKRSCSCSCFLNFFLCLLSIAILVIWFDLQPKLLDFGVPNVEINTLSVDTSQYTATSDISYTFGAHNPNHKMSVYYHPIRTIVWYKGTELGRGTIPAFYQGPRNTTLVDATISGSNVQLSQSSASNLASELSANRVHLDSETKVKFRLKVGALKLPRIPLTFQCDHIVPKSGSSVEKRCDLKLSWWSRALCFLVLVASVSLFFASIRGLSYCERVVFFVLVLIYFIYHPII